MSPPMELDSPTLRDPVQHYRRDPQPPRRELPPITPQGGGGGYGPPDMMHHPLPDRYPQTHHSRGGGGGGMMDFSDQEYSDRAAWERGMVPPDPGPRRDRDRDYYMEDVDPQMKMRMDDRGGGGGGPPMDYNGRYLPPEMREMREIPDSHHEDMRHHPHDRDYPSPYRGQTMVHRDIL